MTNGARLTLSNGSFKDGNWSHKRYLTDIDLILLDVCMMFKVESDQRGVKRPQGKGCDSGAYEYEPT